MRKHFLILMLLTLLPFTAWAEDYSDYTLKIYYGASELTQKVYGGSGLSLADLPLKLEKQEADPVTVSGNDFVVTWSDGSQTAPTLAENVGTYTVTVTSTTHTLPAECTASFTITPATPSVTAPNVASNLSYNGNLQALIVSEGSTNVGTLKFAVKDPEASEAPDANDNVWYEFDSESLKRTEVGTYDLYYKVDVDDNNWSDVAPHYFDQVTIEKGNATITAPTVGSNLVYSGNPVTLFNFGSTNAGTLSYAVTDSDVESIAADAEDTWYAADANELKRTAAGNYKLWYKLTGDNNYNDKAPASIGTATIAPGSVSVTTAPARVADYLTYNGELQTLITAGEVTGGALRYAVTSNNEAPAANAENVWYENAAIDALKRSAAGTYYLWYKVEGDANHNNVIPTAFTTASIEIKKAKIVVTTPAAELNAAVAWDGTAKQVIKKGVTATGKGDLTVYYAVSTSNVAPSAEVVDVWYTDITDEHLRVSAANTYYAYYKIVSNDVNVEPLAPAAFDGAFVINATPASITTIPAAKTLTYNAEAQELVDAGVAVGGELQYSVDNQNWSATIPAETEAGDYQIYFRVKGDGNHTDYQPMTVGQNPVAVSIPVTIAKKNLKAKPAEIPANVAIFGVLPQNGAISNTNYLKVEYDGFAGNDNAASVFTGNYSAPTVAFASDVNSNTNCETIDQTKYIKAGEYAEGIVVSGGSAKNYNIVALKRDLNVAKAKVKIDLKAAVVPNAAYGSSAAEKTQWEIGYESNPANYLNVYVQNGIDANGDATYSVNALPYANYIAYLKTRTYSTGSGQNTTWHIAFNSPILTKRANTSKENGSYLLTLEGAEATNNTEIVAQTNSTNIKFVIGKAVLTVTADNKWKTYGTADPALAFSVTSGNNAYDGLSAEQKAAIKAAMSRAEGETAGEYEITFAESIKSSDLFKDNYTITWKKGWMVIEKANLTIEAKPQTLYLTNTVAKLVQSDIDINGLVKNDALGINDAATVSLAFGTEDIATEGEEQTLVPVDDTEDHEGELTTAGEYQYGIKVVLANMVALAENYNITIKNGALTVIDTDNGIVLNFNADNSDALVAANGKTIEVTFANKTMVKNNWHTMVLPFATTPLELSNLLGQYVIVNRLSDNSTADHVAFELELSEIPAGEAFLIKSGKDMVWDGKKFDANNIGKKLISKDLVKESKGGNMLVGVYNATSVQSTDAQKLTWLGNTAQFKNDGTTRRENKWYEPYSTAKEIAPFEAYLMYAPNVTSAPLITVQEADGTTTAISEIKAGEFQTVKADGWYTLNGVKLQGMPTEKGVYINNGKKVVIK